MDGLVKKSRAKRSTYGNDRPSTYHKSLIDKIDNTDINSPIKELSSSTARPIQKKKSFGLFKKIFFILLLILIVTAISMGIYFSWKVGTVSSKISSNGSSESVFSTISKIVTKNRATLKGEDRGRINILLLGVAGKGRAGGNLTDTIMVASVDTVTKKTALLSLPRDFYVEIADSQYSTKINSIYKYGISQDEGINPLKETIENVTGLTLDYYLVASFAGFEKFVDDIDGIIINNERDIYDPNYPGPNYSYELFALEKGTHLLDGSTALKYARERHDDPQGDFGRAKRQQQVLQSIKSRLFSTKVLFNPFAISNMLDTLGESITTDITLEEMESFLQLSKELDTQNITNVVVDAWKKDSLLKVSHIFYKDVRAFILVPRVGNYSEIQDVASNIFDLDKIKRRNSEIEKEEASIVIINQSGESSLSKKIQDLLGEKLEFKNVKSIKSDSNLVTSSTRIFDSTNGQKPFTLDELIKKLPASLADGNSFDQSNVNKNLEEYDFVVILGSDLVELYSFEEGSIEEMERNQNNSDNKEILIQKNNE